MVALMQAHVDFYATAWEVDGTIKRDNFRDGDVINNVLMDDHYCVCGCC
jgi:hypothetical protein